MHDAGVDAAFGPLRAARDQRGGLTPEERRDRLKRLRAVVRDGAEAIAAAVDADFRGRSRHETLVSEVGVVLAAIDHALPRLRRWAADERVSVGWRYWPAQGRVVKQPLGVVGVLSPWNYPVQLSLMPVVGALAAGCRVLLKPSELAPATAGLITRLVRDNFAPDEFAVITGGADVAASLTRLPLDKIVFTGSGRVARQVLHAAADNLTPVLLELGGKSPAVVHSSADLKVAADSIIAGKLLNAGQTCVAPDHVFVPAALRDAFVTACRDAARRFYPDNGAGPDYSAVLGDGGRARLLALQDGLEQVSLFEAEPAPPKLAPALVIDPQEGSRVLHEEIFGPVLPVVTYTRTEEVTARIASGPDPLALYLFARDRGWTDEMIAKTRSGGVAINETVLHVAVEALPFGGVGASGYGAYHGRAGFDAFTHRRPVFVQSRYSGTRLMRPPYGAMADRVLRFIAR
jgi:acyl-CoA reductase-like NAD-dependent aldehyde dehydrogenase